MIDEKLDPAGKLTTGKLTAMRYLLQKYPKKPTKKDLEFLAKEKKLDAMTSDIDDLFPLSDNE